MKEEVYFRNVLVREKEKMCTALCSVWITGQITFYLTVKYVTIALVKKNKNSFHLIDSICLYPVKLTYSYSLFIHLLHLKRGLCAHLDFLPGTPTR